MFSTAYFCWSKLPQARKSCFSCTIIFVIAWKNSFERNKGSALVIKIFAPWECVDIGMFMASICVCVMCLHSRTPSLESGCVFLSNPTEEHGAQSSCAAAWQCWLGDVPIPLGVHTCFRSGKSWCASGVVGRGVSAAQCRRRQSPPAAAAAPGLRSCRCCWKLCHQHHLWVLFLMTE